MNVAAVQATLHRARELGPEVAEMALRALTQLGALVHENNALRHNNERLTERRLAQEGMLHAANYRAAEAEKRAATAQTMAAHWRLKAQGGNYDATQEEQ